MQIFTLACNISEGFEAFAWEVKRWCENCSLHYRKAIARASFSIHPKQTSKAQKPEEKVEGHEPVFIQQRFQEDFLTYTMIWDNAYYEHVWRRLCTCAGLIEDERKPKLLYETFCPFIQLCGATIALQKEKERRWNLCYLVRMNSCRQEHHQPSLAAGIGPLLCWAAAVTRCGHLQAAACWAKCSELHLGFGRTELTVF